MTTNYVTQDNSQTHKSWTDQWEPRIVFLHKIWNVCEEKLQILYYAILPLSHMFFYNKLLILCVIIFYTSSSHFCSGKPRTANGIQEKDGGMWMWLTISCEWYGWVIALHRMALLYLPSHLKGFLLQNLWCWLRIRFKIL